MSPESFQRYYGIFPEALMMVSADGVILAANRAVAQQIGIPRRTLLGTSLFDTHTEVEENPVGAASIADDAAARIGGDVGGDVAASDAIAARVDADRLSVGVERGRASALRRYLRLCSQSRAFVIGTMQWRDSAGTLCHYRCEGALISPARRNKPAHLLLRLQPREHSARRFSELRHRFTRIAKQMHQQRRLVQELEQRVSERTAALERSNAELQRFAYVASHDLQEPLRMVASYAELLRERYGDQLDLKAHKYMDYTIDGAHRMQALIRDLLSYARIETRAQAARATKLRLVIDETLHNLEVAIREACAVITCDELPDLAVDRPQIRQLYQNLIANAIKFRGSEPPMIHLGAERIGDEWILSVRDNGIGIDPEYSVRIFDMFQRLHNRGRYSGTGIGLAIVKRVIERHGGRVWVESQLGEGATFFVALPANLEVSS